MDCRAALNNSNDADITPIPNPREINLDSDNKSDITHIPIKPPANAVSPRAISLHDIVPKEFRAFVSKFIAPDITVNPIPILIILSVLII